MAARLSPRMTYLIVCVLAACYALIQVMKEPRVITPHQKEPMAPKRVDDNGGVGGGTMLDVINVTSSAVFAGVDDSLLRDLFRLLPRDFNGRCSDVLDTAYGRGIALSAAYRRGRPLVQEKIASIGEHATKEGYIVLEPQIRLLHHLAARTGVATVCETGFNVGMSAFNFLTAKRGVRVHSFDIGRWLGTKVMAEHLQKNFEGRLFVHLGDSVQTVPAFAAANPDVRCDVVLVDGGHFYRVAYADLMNFRRLSVPGRTVVVIDDYPTGWAIRELAPAWEQARMEGVLTEIFRCSNKTSNIAHHKYGTGFSVGVFT